MLQLDQSYFIAQGSCNKCYVHPEDENKCIKIPFGNNVESVLDRELQYMRSLSKRKRSRFEYKFFARLHGVAKTNLGTGQVHDLVRDHTDNKISKTLDYYILQENPEFTDAQLQQALDKLIQLMVKYHIVFTDFSPPNICCQKLTENSCQLVLIDGAGDKNFLPLARWFRYFNHKMIRRRQVKESFGTIEERRKLLLKQ